MLDSVLVANRGEIARRVIKTARRMGIRAVAVYSDADADLPYVREADDAVHIGPAATARHCPGRAAPARAGRQDGSRRGASRLRLSRRERGFRPPGHRGGPDL